MTQLARFCKAYHMRDVQGFTGWENRPPSPPDPGERYAGTLPPNPDIVFLHHDFKLTKSIARDHGVLLEGTDPAWIAYCREVLKFEIPRWCQESTPSAK